MMSTYDPADDADKMRALVQLAASIGDQLANVALSLNAEADMLAGHDMPQRLHVTATLIRRSANRTSAIASDLLTFAGRQPTRPRQLSVFETLLQLAPMLKSMVGPSVQLTVSCDPMVHAIRADYRQFEHIVCALVARARDAVGDCGAITIRASSLRLSSRPSAEDDWVCVEVSDTGLPIRSLERIFEPVLARKGYSLWLGLSKVYGSVAQMAGRIKVETDQSRGSKFTILLPASE